MILLDQFQLNKKENRDAVGLKVQNVCNLLGIQPSWLMMVMWSESRLNAQAVNSQPGDPADPQTRSATRATGLIQFMPDTARRLGTTTQALYRMTSIQQLDYIFWYFKPYAGKITSYFDLYLITFFPDALGKPDSYVLQSKTKPAALIAKQNPIFDTNKDGKITAGEIKRRMYESIPKALVAEVMAQMEKKVPVRLRSLSALRGRGLLSLSEIQKLKTMHTKTAGVIVFLFLCFVCFETGTLYRQERKEKQRIEQRVATANQLLDYYRLQNRLLVAQNQALEKQYARLQHIGLTVIREIQQLNNRPRRGMVSKNPNKQNDYNNSICNTKP